MLGGDDGYNFMSLGFEKLDGQFHLTLIGATKAMVERLEDWAAHTTVNVYFTFADPPSDEE